MENHNFQWENPLFLWSMIGTNGTHNFQPCAAPGLCDHPIAEGKTNRIEAKGLDPLEVGLQ